MVLLDKFSKEFKPGQIVVYPSRPGGKGPLQLVAAFVDDVREALGQITVIPDGDEKVVVLRRLERVAVVDPRT